MTWARGRIFCQTSNFDSLQLCCQLTYRDPQYLFGKIWISLKYIVSIQSTCRIFNIGFALSKGPHLHRVYLVTVCKWGAITEQFEIGTLIILFCNPYLHTSEKLKHLIWIFLPLKIRCWFCFRFGGKDDYFYEFTLGKSYVYLCSTLTMRGWDVLPIKISARTALFSLLFFGTLIYLHWEAMLISYLATRVIGNLVQNFTTRWQIRECQLILCIYQP